MLSKKCKAHLDDVGMTGFQHMKFALGVAGELSLAVLALVVHAFIPRFFTTYTSVKVCELVERFDRMK